MWIIPVKLLCFFAVAGITVYPLRPRIDNKLTPAELVGRHLESIGPAEARSRVHGIKTNGICVLTVKQGGSGQIGGQTLMASEGTRNLIKMTFDSPEYPFESLKFDGKNFTASQFKPGLRTAVASFFLTHEVLFREGLVGGTLSRSWPLLDLQQKNPKLEYAGLKKVAGKQLHALKYTPRKGADLKITLYFDSETFQHIRTEYERVVYSSDQQRIGGTAGLPSATNPRSSPARIHAFEEFSDFKPEGGLNLPHTFKFGLSIQSEVRPALVEWIFNLTEFVFNEPLDTSV
jgi:hypothetical protein